MSSGFEFAVFAKPWPTLSLPELGRHVRQLGFDSIELPVRPGFPCRPEHIETDLPQAVDVLAAEGVRVLNITADLPLDDERLYAACAAAGVTLNRVMFRVRNRPYWEAEAAARRQLVAAEPLCERYQVRIGVQNHCNAFVPVNAMGLHHLLQDTNPRFIGAIWDPAHEALEGVAPNLALDMIFDRLFVVNLKNAYWRRSNGPEAELAQWQVYWTTGRHGRADWAAVAAELKARSYTGPLCFSAEYDDEAAVDRLIVEDLALARALFA